MLVVSVPVANCAVFPTKLSALTLAVAVNVLADTTLAPEIFPPEPVVLMLPNTPLPVAVTAPAVLIFPPDILPVAIIRPAVPKLPTLALPVTSNVKLAVNTLAITLLVTVNDVPVAAPIFGVVNAAPAGT